MHLVDTHTHIHESDYPLDRGDVIIRAREAGVTRMICVGTSSQSSREAVKFATEQEDGIYASIGVHPHEAQVDPADIEGLITVASEKRIVAVGEVGLDYYYSAHSRAEQIPLLERQLQLAVDHDLPVIFHVRDAFEDFWPIYSNFRKLRGVLHSFTDSRVNLQRALDNELYIGVNGISTFTKDDTQNAMFTSIPLEKMLLETDAPYLTPVPRRGKVNEPAFVAYVAQFQAEARSITLDAIGNATTTYALNLFSIA